MSEIAGRAKIFGQHSLLLHTSSVLERCTDHQWLSALRSVGLQSSCSVRTGFRCFLDQFSLWKTGAFVLYLLVSLSVPVTQRFTFLDYTMRSGNTSVALRVGLWGSCRQNLTPFAGPLVCQRATVPYLIGTSFLAAFVALYESRNAISGGGDWTVESVG